jgi:transposase
LKLLLENIFPRIWVPSPENRDLRQLLWHRHRLVQMRTRIQNQLQALAMNEGQRWKKKLWSEPGRAQLEKFPLSPWASRRRNDLLELLDRLDPKIAELTTASEQEARKWPEVLRLMTHPGVGPLTALAFVALLGTIALRPEIDTTSVGAVHFAAGYMFRHGNSRDAASLGVGSLKLTRAEAPLHKPR